MALVIEDLASVGVLVANAVFIVVSVGSYLRMNAHEAERQSFLSRALNDHRESGRELKAVARNLERLMERAERMRLWQREGPEDSWRGRTEMHAGAAADDEALGPEPDLARLRPPEAMQQLSPAAFAEWQRLHEIELDRVLSQRRRLQAQLAAALQQQQQQQQANRRGGIGLREQQERLQELQALQARLQEEQARGAKDEAALQRVERQLAKLQGEMERQQIEKDFIEDRLLLLDSREREQRASA